MRLTSNKFYFVKMSNFFTNPRASIGFVTAFPRLMVFVFLRDITSTSTSFAVKRKNFLFFWHSFRNDGIF